MKILDRMKMALMAFVAVLAMCGCEKMVLDDEEGGTTDETKATDGNVIIRASLYNIVPFETRAGVSLTDYCSTIQFVIYQNGEKVKGITQKKGESSYGQTALTLSPGTYQLLVLAHSCQLGNPTVSNPSSIQFTNTGSGYSDTFYYYGDLQVSEEQGTHDITLERAVSMVRVTITDAIPAEVTKIRLYYEGESGVFNAVTGMGGTTNSKQSINYNVQGYSAPLSLGAYTFLRNEEGTLTMTITAFDSKDNVIAEKHLTDVPMKNRMMTEYSGRLFSESSASATLVLSADTEWKVYRQLTF